MWNPNIATSQFQVVHASTAGLGSRNGVNNVFFDDTIYGSRFGSNTLAVTLSYRSGSRIVESDVIFNTAISFDSYRGALRRTIDFRRVAIHEFGHVLGLGHPDEGGQSRVAVMNSIVSNVELPQTDDTGGVRALYGEPTETPAPSPPSPPSPPTPAPPETGDFPPRDQSFNFRQQLEIKYREGLHRSPAPTFVDLEGSIVWIQEYLRYRDGACNHAEAVTRVLMQIDGLGIQPVCGAERRGFPPRNESFAFRQQLENKYRDGLRRNASLSAVDLEGDVVWTQEYLYYRLGRCPHQTAVDRVFAQIDGRGALPVCSS
jgi:hypothetical protein